MIENCDFRRVGLRKLNGDDGNVEEDEICWVLLMYCCCGSSSIPLLLLLLLLSDLLLDVIINKEEFELEDNIPPLSLSKEELFVFVPPKEDLELLFSLSNDNEDPIPEEPSF